MNDVTENYNKLKQHIQSICVQNTIMHNIRLIAVSKTFPTTDIIQLHTSTGQLAFGENYALELQQKALELIQYGLEWHFIGAIQSNKIKVIAKFAAWVHSLANARHAILLNNNRPLMLPKLNVLIEVNISQDKNKHGVNNLDEIINLATLIGTQKNLVLRGLMGMSGADSNPNERNQQFSQLKQFFDKLKSIGFEDIDTISMGMSDDFKLAIKNGANMLRIGTLVFGKRIDCLTTEINDQN